ncbi:hypothetical protein CHISP_3318 [Chitinispirillum alkaliphilum]|nr:hypothetical protein CHISP_3318 [Chitinispirillum alkaliphilum]
MYRLYKSIWFFILMISFGAHAQYSLQIKACENINECQMLVDSLVKSGIPAYLTEGTVNSIRYHRVRVGVFEKKEMATQFQKYLDWDDSFIVKENEEKQIFSLIVDTINTGVQSYSPVGFLVDTIDAAVAVLNRANVTPFDQYFYPYNVNIYNFVNHEKFNANHVTGIKLSGSSFLFGLRKIVFENPDSYPKENLLKDVKNFSTEYDIPESVIYNSSLTTGDILPVVSIPLLYKWDLGYSRSKYMGEVGFDYADSNGNLILYTDNCELSKTKITSNDVVFIDPNESWFWDNNYFKAFMMPVGTFGYEVIVFLLLNKHR